MTTFDIILAAVLLGFVINGLFKGLIRLLGRLVGLIIGAYVASHYYLLLYGWWGHIFNDHVAAGKVISFIVLFFLVTRLVDLLFYLIEKGFKLLAIVPGSKYINNLAGAALGFLEGSLFLGLILYIISKYALVGAFFGDALLSSKLTPLLLKITEIILPVLPEALRALRSIF